MDWKAEELKAPTVITGRASIIEYAESCCDGLDYEEPRVGQVVWDEYGNYLGQIGDDREVFLPIPSEFLFDSGLHYGNGEGIPPHLLRDAGLGWWLDGDQAVSSEAFGSDIAFWVEDTDMSAFDRDDDTAEENNEADNSDAISHPNDNGMDLYYYGNMDGAMDDVEDYVSKVEVAETDAPTPATHEESKESDENPPKSFDFFGRLSRELRDMIYAQPGMTEIRVKGNDNFDGVLGHGNKLRVTITKPLVSLCLVSKRFSAEYMEVCEDQEALFIRTSQFVHAKGYTDEYGGFEKVRYLEFHLGN